MSDPNASFSRPVRCAVVGAGPAGFYAAGALLSQDEVPVEVDLLDRLPAPFGLVRYGVAPDHQKIKSVVRVFERTASLGGFRFFGNVDVGSDVTVAQLQDWYDAVIFSFGAPSDRSLSVPGEDLPGSHSATEFVAWYNGHPDFVDHAFNLSCKSAVVVGAGNVALDVARILAKSTEELHTTDIANHALEALRDSQIEDIHILARRGPAQVKFTLPELREFGVLENATSIVREDEIQMDEHSEASLEGNRMLTKIVGAMQGFTRSTEMPSGRKVHFRFLWSPIEIHGNAESGVTGVTARKNKLEPTESGYMQATALDETLEIDAGLVLRSVGYRGAPVEGVPFDERRAVVPNVEGRVSESPDGPLVPGMYVAGWAKRGPTGVIGTNKPDGIETAKCLLADAPGFDLGIARPDLATILKEAGVRFVSFEDWKTIDQAEVARGESEGRPRVKMVSVEEMLGCL